MTSKKNKKQLDIKRRKINFNVLLIFAFCVGLILIVVTYAWFSSSIDATVDFVKLTVNRETGLYASLDGVNYGSEIIVNEENILYGITDEYPDHNNKWSNNGLVPVSSNGIIDANNKYFTFFENSRLDYLEDNGRRYLDTIYYDEENSLGSRYVAFDVFLKNISNTPYSDNLYLYDGTGVYLNEGYEEEIPGLFNSIRIGIAWQGFTPDKNADAQTVQNLECNNECFSTIYEPNSTEHSDYSIGKLKRYGIDITNGEYVPTYAVINEGKYLEHDSGHSNIPLNTEYFAEQETITDLDDRLFELPHGITKIRVYIWIEGQDVDSLEVYSTGALVNVTLNFFKDLAGYGL